jgi:RNA 2',3'-cyclic 3'-phosphodiesterase
MRCFVAVWPTPDVVDALEALPRPALDGLRWSARQQWHVTLRFFGDLGTQDVTEASAAVARAAAAAREPPLAQGGPGTRFLGPGLLVWPVEGLGQVASALDGLTAAIGTPPPSRRFYGHITLARGRRGLDLRPATELLSPLGSSWTVTSLSLVASELHPDGARYRVLEEFPCPGAPRSGLS